MKTKQIFSTAGRIKSFSYAFNGLKILLREEHNSWIHIAAAICAVVAGFILKISFVEWIAIIICIVLVFALELINSAIENIADVVSPQKNEMIKKAKDLSAAAVLFAATGAAVIGLIIFIPKII